jgi:hypothetical protein
VRKISIFVMGVLAFFLTATAAKAQVTFKWKPNDMNRPLPPVIVPGTASTQSKPGRPPSDAIVLFNGNNLSQWTQTNGSPAKWKVGRGYFQVVPHTGNIETKQAFGDCQLHVEFREPLPAVGTSQERGNSGVILMGQYEVQVLDVYHNKTYADGEAGAVYAQYPPQVNAARPPGQWQTYDIVFHAPRFSPSGKLLSPARDTVFWNGVLVQDNVTLSGPTALSHGKRPPYKPGPDKAPLQLQDHGYPVRFRNIWIRELKPGQ